MSGLFGAPKIPSPPPVPAPPPVPTIDNARQSQQANDYSVARVGRAASILTSSSGDMAAPTTKKVLLGS